MASPNLPGLSALLVLLVVAMAAEPGFAFKIEADDTITHFPPLLDCGPASSSSAFRANVLSLLAALPAAGPTGLCFSAGGDCLACLSGAAADVAARCNGSRRGATWRSGCFLSYADTNATSSREAAFRAWFYDDDAWALGSLCAADRGAAAECSSCLDESARVVPELMRRHGLSRVHGDAVVVVGYNCFLRVPLEDPLPQWRVYVDAVLAIVEIVVVLCAEVWAIVYCIRRVGQMNQNPA